MIEMFVKWSGPGLLLVILLSGCQPSEVTSARLYLKHGNLEKASEQLQLAVKNYPDNAQAHFLMGATYARLKQFEEMNIAFARSEQVSDEYRPKILSIREFYWTRYFDDGNKAFLRDRYEQAIQNLETAIIIDSTQTKAQKKLAIVLVDYGDLEAALRMYNKLLSITPADLDLLGSAANLYYNLGEYNHVVLVLQKMLTIDPQHPDALANLAMAYDKLDQNEKANLAFQRAIEVNPEDTDLVFLYAVHRYNNNSFMIAIDLFKRVLKDRPGDVESLSNIGNCYLSLAKAKRGELQQAQQQQLSLQELQNIRDDALQNYANAIPYFEQAVSVRKENPVLWRNLSVAYLAIGDREKGSAAYLRSESLQRRMLN